MAEKYPTSMGIMYPYVFPQNTDLPIDYDIEAHCTLMYLGDINDSDLTPESILESLKDIEFNPTGIVDVDKLELFGPENNVLVMTLNSSDLQENFDKVSKVLENASSYSEYRPHITLNENYTGPTLGYTLPTTVGLGYPELWYGDERFNIE